MQAEPCLQWPKGLCRRYETCKFYHAPLDIPALRPGQCSWLKNGAKRCESNATYTENNLPLCFDHTESGRIQTQAANSGEKRSIVAPERVTKRVSGKSRMVNPFEVGHCVGGAKKQEFDKVDTTKFMDSTRPLVVDVGSAQGRFLIQLAQRHASDGPLTFNYVGFELRSGLVDAANEAVQSSSSINGSVLFLQGDAKSNIHLALAPVISSVGSNNLSAPNSTDIDSMSTTSEPLTTKLTSETPKGYVEWLTIQFPDPWTKKKHHKRRLVDPIFVTECATLINHPRGKVYICSDRYDLASYMYDTFAASELWVPLPAYPENGLLPSVEDGNNTTSTTECMHPPADQEAADGLPVLAQSEDDGGEEEEDGEEELAFGADVYREKDLSDTRLWIKNRPFPVGTERDSVAEKKNRPVHRAVFVRRFPSV